MENTEQVTEITEAENTETPEAIETPTGESNDTGVKTKTKGKRGRRPRDTAPGIETRGPAHMSKVAKAAERLPEVTPGASAIIDTLSPGNCDLTDLTIALAHIEHIVRARQTLESQKAENSRDAGQLVRIVSGDGEFVGTDATVLKAGRIKIQAQPVGSKKSIWLFTADTVLIAEDTAVNVITDAETEAETDAETDAEADADAELDEEITAQAV